MTVKQARAVGAATVLAAIGSTGYLIGTHTADRLPAPMIGFKAVVPAPACLTTMTIPGRMNNKGVYVYAPKTANPTTTERVCWKLGYRGKP